MKVTANFKNFGGDGTKVWEADSWTWGNEGTAVVLQVRRREVVGDDDLGALIAEICIPLDAVYFIHVEW